MYLPGILVGAWTGYITNDIALRMIFEEFRIGIFRFGGVIPRTRTEFTQGVIDLVNDELIRPEVLRGRIGGNEFINAATRIVKDAASRVLTYAENHETIADLIDGIGREGSGADGNGTIADAVGGIGRDGREDSFTGPKASVGTAQRLADIVYGVLAADCGGLCAETLKSLLVSKDAAELAGRLAGKLIGGPEFTAAAAEFIDSCGDIKIRQLFGDRYFSDVKNKILYEVSGAADMLGVDLPDESREFADTAAYLVFDGRVFERLSVLTRGKNLADLINLTDLSGWDKFFEEKLAKALNGAAGGYGADIDGMNDDAAGGGDTGITEALKSCERIRVCKFKDIVRPDTQELDGALAGVYALITGAARELFNERRAEICSMLESSIEYALDARENAGPGLASVARRAFFSGAVGKYKLFERLEAFAVSWCAGLSQSHIAGNAIAGVLDKNAAELLSSEIFEELFISGNGAGADGFFRDASLRLIGRIPEYVLKISPAAFFDSLGEDGRAGLASGFAGYSGAALGRMLTDGITARNAVEDAVSEFINSTGDKRFGEILEKSLPKPGVDTQNAVKRLFRSLKAYLGADGGARESNKIRDSRQSRDSRELIKLSGVIAKQIAKAARQAIVKKFPTIKTKRVTDAVKARIEAFHPDTGTGSRFTSIFDRLTGRFESAVREKINGAIRNKLDSFRDEELSTLARTFFGQLKHIVVLGGILGAFVGIFTTVLSGVISGFADGAGNGALPFIAFFANVALLALIGWLTNVVALEMLFRPRRAIKLPGFTLQSVISQNKKRFAEAVASFLSSVTEEPETGAETQGGNVREDAVLSAGRIEDMLTGQAVKSGPALLGNYAAAAGDWAGAKIESALIKNWAQISGFINDNIHRALCTPAYARDEYRENREPPGVPTDGLYEAIASFLNSNASVSKILTGTDGLTDALTARMSKWLFDMDDIEVRSFLRRALMGAYDTVYSGNAGRPVFPGPETWGAQRLKNTPYGAMTDVKPIVRSRGELAETIEKLIKSKRAPGMIAAALGGPLTIVGDDVEGFLLKNKKRICRSVRRMCVSLLTERGGAYAKKLAGFVAAQTGALASIALRLTDGDEFLTAASENFITVQIPAFIERRADDIDERIGRILSQLPALLSSRDFSRRFLTIDTNGLTELLEETLRDGRVSSALSELIADSLADIFGGVPVSEIAALFGADNAQGFMTHINGLIQPVGETITESLHIEANDLAGAASVFIRQIIKTVGSNINVSDIFGGVRQSDLNILTELLAKAFLQSEKVYGIKNCLLRGVREENAAFENLLGEILEDLPDDGYIKDISDLAKKIIDRIAADIAGVCPEKIAPAAARILAKPAARAIADGMGDILKAVGLYAIAEERINAMDTGNIERVFRSFAGRYITRIKLYGLWGGVFGIHPVITLATAAAALANEIAGRVGARAGNREE